MGRTEELIKSVDRYGAHNYLPLPVVLDRGKGSKVWDVEGKEYLDFLSCYSALNFGHQHPRILSAMKGQMEMLCVVSRAFHTDQLCLFSEELVRFCSMDSVLFMNSGAEAVETAVKAARKWGYEKKRVPSDKATIIVAKNNFHGRTVSVISFSTEELYRKNFGPFTPGFTVVSFGDIGAMKAAIDSTAVAVLIEPIQAEAGILIPPQGYLKGVRTLCEENNMLLMFDEIQTGMGRTGRDFCYQHENVTPDMLILGKSLGGGILPLSAVLAREGVLDVFTPGTHGSTFGGNPLACRVGRESLRILREERLSERSQWIGGRVMKLLSRETLPGVKEVRGKGALIGIELETATGGARKYCERLAKEGVLCKETHDYVIRIAPPLVISEEELVKGIGTVVKVIRTA